MSPSHPTVVVLAAGQGTRMRSSTPKVLHDLCGRPMIDWPVAAALESGAGRVVVVDTAERALEPRLPPGAVLAVQPVADGSGGAVLAAADHLDGGTVVVISGDVPLVTAATLRGLVEAHETAAAAATVVTMELDDPAGYGRVVRAQDGSVDAIVETKRPGDATEAELRVREVNAGVYAFAATALVAALERVGNDNAQGEIYLPGAIAVLRGDGARVASYTLDDPGEVLGVNTLVELARVRALAQRRIHETHMLAGVTVVDPASTTIEAGVRIGPDTVVHPSTFLRGATEIGARCSVGPMAVLKDAVLGDAVSVVQSHLDGCEIRAGATVGPFAYLRPGALLRERSKAGTFVEIKNSDVGAGSKVPHLAYVGDADIGPDVNLGAATITANYDGVHKHRTTIGARVHTGVDTTFVAPVSVGEDAVTAAGSVITEDVPAGALGVARERQRNIEGYTARRRERV